MFNIRLLVLRFLNQTLKLIMNLFQIWEFKCQIILVTNSLQFYKMLTTSCNKPKIKVIGYCCYPTPSKEWRKTMEPQKPDNSPGPGPEVVERQSPKQVFFTESGCTGIGWKALLRSFEENILKPERESTKSFNISKG